MFPSTAIIRTAVRETGASYHHDSPIKDKLKTPRTPIFYPWPGLRGCDFPRRGFILATYSYCIHLKSDCILHFPIDFATKRTSVWF